jgi:hypothetical protein
MYEGRDLVYVESKRWSKKAVGIEAVRSIISSARRTVVDGRPM